MSILFSTNLKTYTKGSSIFNVGEICFNDNNMLLTNTILCATDGAPSMVGLEILQNFFCTTKLDGYREETVQNG